MNLKLRLKLQEKIAEWMDENFEDSDWPEVYVGEKTDELMTEAAAAVFDVLEDIQEYLKKDGYLED